MIDETPLLAGEFGMAARLSAKALRIYAERGLLVPARIDPVTGYRYYYRGQIPRARLISRLRALGLSLSRIAELADLPADVRQAELRAWLIAQEEEVRRRRDIVTTLADVEVAGFGDIRIRQVPQRKVLSVESRTYVETLEDFVKDARARLRTQAGSGDAPVRVHFHGLVTRDSDGPVEVTIPVDGPVEPVGDLRVRLEPAHDEAFIPVSQADADFPGILRVYDALERWIDENLYLIVTSPVEVHPGTDGAFLDVAYPVSTLERG